MTFISGDSAFPMENRSKLTFGPTSQEGIAMAPDGKSLITVRRLADSTVWLHDKDGDHQISSEGNTIMPAFSSDGHSLYFLMANGQTHGNELWIKELDSGKGGEGLAGYTHAGVLRIAGRERSCIRHEGSERPSKPVDSLPGRRSSPVQISSTAVEDSPYFLPDGELIFRAIEGGSNFLYRMKADGTGRRK